MRTSPSQFDMMVTFMKQHGDLSKPSSNARGKMLTIKHWEDLTQVLNSDGSGETKSSEKWKKVWSDLKNNTKKRQLVCIEQLLVLGGGPAMHAKLTDLELRVLSLIGVQVATGLASVEAGLSQGIEQGTSQPHPSAESSQHDNEPVLPLTRALSSPPLVFTVEEVQSTQNLNMPRPSTAPAQPPPNATPATAPLNTFVEVQIDDTDMLSPTRHSSQVHVVQPDPALSGRTTPRRARPSRSRASPRRRVRPSYIEQAANQFLQAEEFWRKFKVQQHRDYIDMRREQNRIREMEVQAQREWQSIGLRVLDMLDKLLNKFCKD